MQALGASRYKIVVFLGTVLTVILILGTSDAFGGGG